METGVRDVVPQSLLEREGEMEREHGKQRLLEALQSHMWSSMRKLAQEEQDTTQENKQPEALREGYVDFASYSALIRDAEEGGGEDDGGLEAFEAALNSAREMRQHALSLPDEERRAVPHLLFFVVASRSLLLQIAGKFALHLLTLMEGLDDDDDDE